MKHEVYFKPTISNDSLKSLLVFYCSSKLDHNSSYSELEKMALKYIKTLKKAAKDDLVSIDISFSAESFEYPSEFSKSDKFDFNYGFENFFITVKNLLDNYTPSFVDLETERQASPPIGAYEEVGHNKEVNVKKMNYSYLYD